MNRLLAKIESRRALIEVLTEIGKNYGYTNGLCFGPATMNGLESDFGTLDESNFWKFREYFRVGNCPDSYAGVDLYHYLYSRIQEHELIGVLEKSEHMFIHHSITPGKVAYTPDAVKGMKDIQIVTTIGRLLKKLKPDLSDEIIKNISAKFAEEHGEVSITYGESEEDFLEGIESGPSESCMQGMDFRGHVHPAAAYATGDMIIATIKPDGDRITGRTIINKETKEFSRIYGDAPRLKSGLERAGFVQKIGALSGCRLLRIPDENGNGFIMPYVDAGVGSGGGSLFVTEEDGFWMLNDRKRGLDTYCGYSQRGIISNIQNRGYGDEDDYDDEGETECDVCNNMFDDDDIAYSSHEQENICPRCLERHYVRAVISRRDVFGFRRDYVLRDSCVYLHTIGEHVLESIVDEMGVVYDEMRDEFIDESDARECVHDGMSYHIDDCTRIGTRPVLGGYFYIHNESMRYHEGDLYRHTGRGGGGTPLWAHSEEIQNWLEEDESTRDVYEYVKISEWADYVGTEHRRQDKIDTVGSLLPHLDSSVYPQSILSRVIPADAIPEAITWYEVCEILRAEGALFSKYRAFYGTWNDLPNGEPFDKHFGWMNYKRLDGVAMPSTIEWERLCTALLEIGDNMEFLRHDGVWERSNNLSFCNDRDCYRRCHTPTPALPTAETSQIDSQVPAPTVGGGHTQTPAAPVIPITEMPVDITWQDECYRLQREGVVFEMNFSDSWGAGQFGFSSPWIYYRRQDRNPMPQEEVVTWREQCRRMQSEGVVFELHTASRGWTSDFSFDFGLSANRYRIKTVSPEHNTATPVAEMPVDIIWKDECHRLQEGGVEFELYMANTWCSSPPGGYSFSETHDRYRRVDGSPMPAENLTWREQCTQMQMDGVSFEVFMPDGSWADGEHLVFNLDRARYRIRPTEPAPSEPAPANVPANVPVNVPVAAPTVMVSYNNPDLAAPYGMNMEATSILVGADPAGPIPVIPITEMPMDITWREECDRLQRAGVVFEMEFAGNWEAKSYALAFSGMYGVYRRQDREPMPPEVVTWQEQCQKMQSEGVEFEIHMPSGTWVWNNSMLFTGDRHEYRIKLPTSEPVEPGWQERYSKLQSMGVEFEMHKLGLGPNDWHTEHHTWAFDGIAGESAYRIKRSSPTETTIEMYRRLQSMGVKIQYEMSSGEWGNGVFFFLLGEENYRISPIQ